MLDTVFETAYGEEYNLLVLEAIETIEIIEQIIAIVIKSSSNVISKFPLSLGSSFTSVSLKLCNFVPCLSITNSSLTSSFSILNCFTFSIKSSALYNKTSELLFTFSANFASSTDESVTCSNEFDVSFTSSDNWLTVSTIKSLLQLMPSNAMLISETLGVISLTNTAISANELEVL